MHSDLHIHVGRASASAVEPGLPVPATEPSGIGTDRATIALRRAHADERAAVDRLAKLDGARRLTGDDVLLAVVDGEPVAALSLDDGRVVADPFRPTAEVVDLLRVRARRLAAPARSRSRRRRLRAPRIRAA